MLFRSGQTVSTDNPLAREKERAAAVLGAALFSFSFCYFLLLSVRNDIAKLIFDDLLAIAFCPKSPFLKQKLVHPAPPPASTPTTPEQPPCRGCHLHKARRSAESAVQTFPPGSCS